ncbi:MAG TPA: AMP-binding protein [Actinocrinis sp.]|uniref:AMP-binding protein n=1 Tax=Actinocrinis sp. TaxID=1920516 RepID=UPI002DDD5C29|nr:AMP-binding protein [Actinocrinis sp.]HEV2342496.1 AMP-binding protein [Actinocrinis sp.]
MLIRFTDRTVGPPAGVIRARRIRHLRQDEAVVELSSLPDAEWALLAACASPDWDLPIDASIPQLIAEQVCINPDAVAVVADGEEMSYAQLWTRAGAVAARLRLAGVRRGHLVGLCCERPSELVVGMLGILRSGAAYVPMDPSYSAERLTFMREDIGLRVIVAEAGIELPAGAYRKVIVDSEPVPPADIEADGLFEDDPWAAGPDDLAYLSYPAGPGESPTIMASHRNVLSLLDATRRFG